MAFSQEEGNKNTQSKSKLSFSLIAHFQILQQLCFMNKTFCLSSM